MNGSACSSDRPPDRCVISAVSSACPIAISCRVSAEPGWRRMTRIGNAAMPPPRKNAFQTRTGTRTVAGCGPTQMAVAIPASHWTASSHRNIRSVCSQISCRYSA